ncbi:hypothetical protein BJ742DRAFT_809575 [Cladochytrium replicatum]|nr:hypothetical protein BJ742DRAFT_809575 [Cladochytrium replicatum]
MSLVFSSAPPPIDDPSSPLSIRGHSHQSCRMENPFSGGLPSEQSPSFPQTHYAPSSFTFGNINIRSSGGAATETACFSKPPDFKFGDSSFSFLNSDSNLPFHSNADPSIDTPASLSANRSQSPQPTPLNSIPEPHTSHSAPPQPRHRQFVSSPISFPRTSSKIGRSPLSRGSHSRYPQSGEQTAAAAHLWRQRFKKQCVDRIRQSRAKHVERQRQRFEAEQAGFPQPHVVQSSPLKQSFSPSDDEDEELDELPNMDTLTPVTPCRNKSTLESPSTIHSTQFKKSMTPRHSLKPTSRRTTTGVVAAAAAAAAEAVRGGSSPQGLLRVRACQPVPGRSRRFTNHISLPSSDIQSLLSSGFPSPEEIERNPDWLRAVLSDELRQFRTEYARLAAMENVFVTAEQALEVENQILGEIMSEHAEEQAGLASSTSIYDDAESQMQQHGREEYEEAEEALAFDEGFIEHYLMPDDIIMTDGRANSERNPTCFVCQRSQLIYGSLDQSPGSEPTGVGCTACGMFVECAKWFPRNSPEDLPRLFMAQVQHIYSNHHTCPGQPLFHFEQSTGLLMLCSDCEECVAI